MHVKIIQQLEVRGHLMQNKKINPKRGMFHAGNPSVPDQSGCGLDILVKLDHMETGCPQRIKGSPPFGLEKLEIV